MPRNLASCLFAKVGSLCLLGYTCLRFTYMGFAYYPLLSPKHFLNLFFAHFNNGPEKRKNRWICKLAVLIDSWNEKFPWRNTLHLWSRFSYLLFFDRNYEIILDEKLHFFKDTDFCCNALFIAPASVAYLSDDREEGQQIGTEETSDGQSVSQSVC